MRTHVVKVLTAVVLLAGIFVSGCSHAPKVTRTDVDKPVDLSGRWNDTDSRMVSEEMIKDCLARPWYNHFNEKNHRIPVVIVGTINNRSYEHIDSETFLKDLEMSLLNSNQVTFVASKTERGEVREERDDQNTGGNTDPETIRPKGKETGADYLLQGSIHFIKDEIKGKYAILYQVNLELVDLTTNRKAWIGEKQIKKIVERSQYSM